VKSQLKRALILAGILAAVAGGAWLTRAGLSRVGSDAARVPVLEMKSAPFTRVVTAEGYLRPVRATPLTAPQRGRAVLIAWLAEDGAQVKKGEVVIRFDSEEANRALADGQADREAALTRINKEKLQVENSLNERTRAASLTQEEMRQANELGRKDPRFFPRNEVIESEIDESLLKARLQQTQQARSVEKQLGHSRVALLAVDQEKAEREARRAEETLEALEVRAPHDGTFVIQRWGWGQRVLQAGDRAFSSMRVAEVATSDRMDAEVAVLEADAGGLVAGKRAQVVLDARPDLIWKATVKKVDPFPKSKHPEVPTQYFGALLSIEGNTAGVKPGQRLRASIILDELPQALAVPRQAIFRSENSTFVYRRGRWGADFEKVPVTLGSGTVGRVVVMKGLVPGDRVALRDPSRSADEVSSQAAPGRRGGVGSAPPQERQGRGRGPGL
jgi:multidrug efflux pump subunit AcrA (membrane-fusion protein)